MHCAPMAVQGKRGLRFGIAVQSQRRQHQQLQAEQEEATVEGAGSETARGLLGQDEQTSSKLLDVVAAPSATPRHNLAKNQAKSEVNTELFKHADDGDAPGLKRALEAGGNPNW
jgi:hypothetical protein